MGPAFTSPFARYSQKSWVILTLLLSSLLSEGSQCCTDRTQTTLPIRSEIKPRPLTRKWCCAGDLCLGRTSACSSRWERVAASFLFAASPERCVSQREPPLLGRSSCSPAGPSIACPSALSGTSWSEGLRVPPRRKDQMRCLNVQKVGSGPQTSENIRFKNTFNFFY